MQCVIEFNPTGNRCSTRLGTKRVSRVARFGAAQIECKSLARARNQNNEQAEMVIRKVVVHTTTTTIAVQEQARAPPQVCGINKQSESQFVELAK